MLASSLGIPYFGKDGFKDLLFDTIGWSDRDWSRKVGIASYELLFAVAESLLSAGTSLVVEANFYPEQHAARFSALRDRLAARIVEVYCTASTAVLRRRFVERWESGDRHPGHVQNESLEEDLARLGGDEWGPLGIEERFDVDTTDVGLEQLSSIVSQIVETIGGRP
jgi:predicted kinase